MSCAKMAEPIDLQFGLWTPVGQRKYKFNRIHQVVPMYPTTLCHELCKWWIRWDQDPPYEGAFWGERVAHCKV